MSVRDLVVGWEQTSGGELSAEEMNFIADVAMYCPTLHLWSDEPGRHFERLAVEGDADDPRLVCYFRFEVNRPGLMMAYEWPIRPWEVSDDLDWAVWMAHLMEQLEEAGSTLPRESGPDGVARV